MRNYFTKDFGRFLFGFLAILGAAFGIIVATSAWNNAHPVDNVALPE